MVVTIDPAGLVIIFWRGGRLGGNRVASRPTGAASCAAAARDAGGEDGIYGGSISVPSRLESGAGSTCIPAPTSTPLTLTTSARGGVGVAGTISGCSVSSVSLKSGFLDPLSRR